jgi:hypothetical protein
MLEGRPLEHVLNRRPSKKLKRKKCRHPATVHSLYGCIYYVTQPHMRTSGVRASRESYGGKGNPFRPLI